MKKLATVLVKQNEPLEFMELEIPPLKPGQVLVEVHYSGILGQPLLRRTEGQPLDYVHKS